LVGRQVLAVRSKGKHLFIELDGGMLVRSHLGLYGTWHSYPRGAPWRKPARQASLVLETEGEVFVCFNAREVEVLSSAGFRLADAELRLGPDLTGEGLDPGLPARRARDLLAPETRLVDLLLDQRVASGIGNVYKCEVLFLSRQSPRQRLGEVPNVMLEAMYGLAAELLRRNLAGGPRVTRFIGDGRGDLWVYGRADRPCFRCGTRVRRDPIGDNPRSTYWCPLCQTGPVSAATVLGPSPQPNRSLKARENFR